MVDSITFNTADNKLTVTFVDETAKDYFDATTYLADYPDRQSDVIAMGWIISSIAE
jgi:hypothetical protein